MKPIVISITVDDKPYKVVVSKRKLDGMLIAETWEPSQGVPSHFVTMTASSGDLWGLVRTRGFVGAEGAAPEVVLDKYRAHVLARQAQAFSVITKAIPLNEEDLGSAGAVTLMAGLGETRTLANLKKKRKKEERWSAQNSNQTSLDGSDLD